MASPSNLRPHDVCVLLQRALTSKVTYRELATKVGLSVGEAHNSESRLAAAKLVARGKGQVNVRGALEFLTYGVPYVFPGKLGAEARGVPTAFSAPPLVDYIKSTLQVVWPSVHGNARGYSLEPLCAYAPETSLSNPELYYRLALVDALRIGRARERKLAIHHLEKLLKEGA